MPTSYSFWMGANKPNNYAFIDSQNLNLGVQAAGWQLDLVRFRIYLRDKYHVQKALLFIGFVKSNEGLYDFLESAGYQCIFKPVLTSRQGVVKGNCDAELVLHAMIELPTCDKAVLVTGDGDFYCLAEYLEKENKLESLLIPNRKQFSALLRVKRLRSYLRYVDDLRNKLEYKKKRGP